MSKTRVTRKSILKEKARRKKERSTSYYQAKKRIIPGPYTNLDPPCATTARLYTNDQNLAAQLLGPVQGTYTQEKSPQKGWYHITFNIQLNHGLIKKHGLTPYLSAVEKSLNSNPTYNTIIITQHNTYDPARPYLSLRGRTNQKNIPHFRAIRRKKFIIIPKKPTPSTIS